MSRAFAFLLLVACAGPSQQQLAETPAATETRPSAQSRVSAPPASVDDKERERAVQRIEDMETTQRAYEEAGEADRAAPPPPLPGQAAPVKKKGPAEQAELPKKGPAEPAPPSK